MLETISIILIILMVFLLCLYASKLDYDLHNLKEDREVIEDMKNKGYPIEVIEDITRMMNNIRSKEC